MFRTLKTIIQFQKRQDGCKMGQRIMKSWANSLNIFSLQQTFSLLNCGNFLLSVFISCCFGAVKKGTENRLNLKAFYFSYSEPLLFKVSLWFVCMCVYFIRPFCGLQNGKKKNYKRKY